MDAIGLRRLRASRLVCFCRQCAWQRWRIRRSHCTAQEKENLCDDYFRNIDQITADTAFISNDIWLVAKDSNIVYVSVNNQIFETDISQTLDMRPSQYSLSTQKVTYQGITCTYWNKNVDITQQYCEEGNPDLDLVRNDYSNIHHKDVPMLRGYSENSNEFEECIKQFNLK